eukprot:TRINITY_DN15406_c1_g1_i1.p1 TRINITY_DN15406_c1_g1~~TRINITY_DN15406_c1_g1_i1.p1  ORF type:complete len:561 (-),score=103.48 TRINITY_DN15406_c1_g1_i1:94-1752(-)
MAPKAEAKPRVDPGPETGDASGGAACEKDSVAFGESSLGLTDTSTSGSDPHAEDSRASRSPAGSGVKAVRQLNDRKLESQASPRPETNSCAVDTEDLETCSICLDQLSGSQLGVCMGSDGFRSCLHYFHLACLRRVEGAHCPQCRVRFHERAVLPRIQEAASWSSLISTNGDGLSRREISAALRATILLSSEHVEDLVGDQWSRWSEGQEFLSAKQVKNVIDEVTPYLPNSEFSGMSSSSSSTSMAGKDKDKDKDEHAKLEDGHSKTGVVCKCGQIHVRRGDRVRRGVGTSEVDGLESAAGQLGTVIRVHDPGQESVLVKWDRSDGSHSYIWPDPTGQVLAPACYFDVGEDTSAVQAATGLSSFAAEELLRRVSFKSPEAAIEAAGKDFSEDSLRKEPELFHRVRLLPDSQLVQRWFDKLPPCQCNRSGCTGGVHWTSRADKHLGREGLVLKIDDSDDTVLVETKGPCDCQLWYPRLAVEPVFDPDLQDEPLFKVSGRVECRMEHGWERGVVEEVLWQGPIRRGPCPYTVTLDSGKTIFVPTVNLIRSVREG